jgi:hypothetical protein
MVTFTAARVGDGLMHKTVLERNGKKIVVKDNPKVLGHTSIH